MRKKHYTSGEIFNIIVERLKEKNEYPQILEYSSSTSINIYIKSRDWYPIGILRFGPNEGIYIHFETMGEPDHIPLGAFKTLDANQEALRIMAKLQADFIWECRAFMDEHMESFK